MLDGSVEVKSKKRLTWQIWYFRHICWHCLWHHWYRPHGTKWHHSWLCFGNFQMWNVNFSQTRWKLLCIDIFVPLWSVRHVILLWFDSPLNMKCGKLCWVLASKYFYLKRKMMLGIKGGKQDNVMARKLEWRNFVSCGQCNNSLVISLLILSGKIGRQVSAFLYISVLCVCHSWSSWCDFSMAW